ncbi:MAG: lycopene cyclase domain-containing protein [Polyangiaceae bacterium]
MRWLYLTLDGLALLGPLGLSFDKRVAFHRNYRELFAAIGLMMSLFVPMDMLFVAWDVWGFDPRYVLGVQLGNLPIEEWLFFPVVSYGCLFIYECLRYYVRTDPLARVHRPVLTTIAGIGLLLAVTHPLRIYCSLKVGATAIVVLLVTFFLRPRYLSRFLLTYLLSFIPFLLMNGVLTGAFIDGEVVWYASQHIVGVRMGTIPVEDAYYSLLMLLTTTIAYETLKQRRVEQKTFAPSEVP